MLLRLRLLFAAAAASAALVAACSSSSSSGSATDSGAPKGDASADSGSMTSACGHPGDKGNSLGVGQYCTGGVLRGGRVVRLQHRRVRVHPGYVLGAHPGCGESAVRRWEGLNQQGADDERSCGGSARGVAIGYRNRGGSVQQQVELLDSSGRRRWGWKSDGGRRFGSDLRTSSQL
jgi:hypothetical protein